MSDIEGSVRRRLSLGPPWFSSSRQLSNGYVNWTL